MQPFRILTPWVFLALLAYAAGPCGLEATPSSPPPLPERYRFVFVVDTSASMMGLGDGKAVIFPKVQAELIRFLGDLPAGAEVVILPFHQGPQGQARFRLPEERAKAQAYIRSLKATGQNTWIYRTLVALLENLPIDPGLATVYYIFTDGVDNDRRGPYRMRDVVERFRLRQGPYDWIYYVALGAEVPPEVTAGLGLLPRTRVERARIGEVPPIGAYTFKPQTLDLGNLKGQPEGRVEVLLEAQGRPGPLRLRVEDQALQERGAFLEVQPQTLGPGRQTLRFRLAGGDRLPDGMYQAWLCLTPPQGAVVRPQAVRIRLAHHPPALYRLIPLAAPEALELPKGGTAELRYRLEGNAWASAPVEVRLETPKGLRGELNGAPGPIALRPGQELALRLRNEGLGGGVRVQPRLEVQAPLGAQVEAPPLPPVLQPKTWLERLLALWWLLLLLALLLAYLLLRGWSALRPWGRGVYIGPECQEKTLHLKGRVDLGRLTGNPELEGLLLGKGPGGRGIIHAIPAGLEVRVGRSRLEEGEPVEPKEEMVFRSNGREVGRFRLE